MFEIAQFLIETRLIDVNAIDQRGRSFLYRAVGSGNIQLVNYLSQCPYFDVKNIDQLLGDNEFLKEVLHDATVNENMFEVVRFLIEKYHIDSKCWEMRERNLTFIQYIYAQGREVYNFALFTYLFENCHFDLNAISKDGITLLQLASYDEDLALVKMLNEIYGANLNIIDGEGGYSVLELAVLNKFVINFDLFKYLIQLPALDERLIDKFLEKLLDRIRKDSSLTWKEDGELEILRFLIETYHVDVKFYERFGCTILHYLIKQETENEAFPFSGYSCWWDKLIDICDLIDVNACDMNGCTVLHFAAESGVLKSVKFLIEKCGANINAVTQSGNTVLSLASKSGNLDLVKFIHDVSSAKEESSIPRDRGMEAVAEMSEPEAESPDLMPTFSRFCSEEDELSYSEEDLFDERDKGMEAVGEMPEPEHVIYANSPPLVDKPAILPRKSLLGRCLAPAAIVTTALVGILGVCILRDKQELWI